MLMSRVTYPALACTGGAGGALGPYGGTKERCVRLISSAPGRIFSRSLWLLWGNRCPSQQGVEMWDGSFHRASSPSCSGVLRFCLCRTQWCRGGQRGTTSNVGSSHEADGRAPPGPSLVRSSCLEQPSSSRASSHWRDTKTWQKSNKEGYKRHEKDPRAGLGLLSLPKTLALGRGASSAELHDSPWSSTGQQLL